MDSGNRFTGSRELKRWRILSFYHPAGVLATVAAHMPHLAPGLTNSSKRLWEKSTVARPRRMGGSDPGYGERVWKLTVTNT